MLPLTIFEKYMFLDDRAEYPMDSFRRLLFSGPFNTDVFVQSLAAVVRWNPMFRSIVKQKGQQLYWQEIDTPLFVKRSTGNSCPVPERIQLRNEPGFKVYIAQDDAVSGDPPHDRQTQVLLQFHHSVSDGIGEMEFIGDVLTDYAVRITGQTPAENPRQLDPELLKIRGQSGLTMKSYFRYFFDTIFTTRQILLGMPSPLAPCRRVPEVLTDYYAFCSHEISSEETAAYFAAAKAKGVTVNDLLLCGLFTAMGSWRQRWADSLPEKNRNPNFRAAVPMNLRTGRHKQIPASNTVTMLFLDRRYRQCLEDKEKVLRGVRREMEWIKRTEQKHYLLTTMQMRDRLPGGLAMSLRYPQCRSTVVLSNLGQVLGGLPLPRREDGKLRIGESVLEEIDANPPIRYGTLFSFSVLTYAGRLRFVLRYDSQNVTAEQANDFLYRNVRQFAGRDFS
ncbi:MAG: hypothetical protein LBH00_01505 [Planctomycetaceae bacterium]|jgi:NRPS condensation-like uncharacterized protein|nr:hypothetical protein [Planctomycetaceae bacterium]